MYQYHVLNTVERHCVDGSSLSTVVVQQHSEGNIVTEEEEGMGGRSL